MALHLNQTRIAMPRTGCRFSDHCMLAVIMPECAGGVAPPEFVKVLDYSENRKWTWPCELHSRCLSGGTCHQNRMIVSPDPPICHSTLYTAIPMRYHTVSRRNRFEVAKYALWQNRRRLSHLAVHYRGAPPRPVPGHDPHPLSCSSSTAAGLVGTARSTRLAAYITPRTVSL